MSNKVEAATGGTPPNTFEDAEGDVYTVTQDLYGDDDILKLRANGDATSEVIFFKADATKIIALIAEAAK